LVQRRLLALPIAGLALLVASAPSVAQIPPEEITIAFIGDQGLGSSARAVLELIRNEGADAVVHSGDFDYADDPAAWDSMISGILGDDMAYFASAGNHDDAAFYGPGGYQEFLEARLNRLGIVWNGDLGVASTLSYRGIFLVLTAPDIFANRDGDSVHAPFIRDALAGTDAIWRISSFHKNMHAMQTGEKSDETGWGVYEESRRGGAIIATAHEHSYSRTHLLSQMATQSCAVPNCAVPPDNTLELAVDDPATLPDEGRSFAFVCGLGGRGIRRLVNDGAWFATVYTSSQGASHGALFGVFNYRGDPRLAYFYLKDVTGHVADEFFVSSPIGGGPPPPPPNQAPSGTIGMPPGFVSVERGEPVRFAGAGMDPDGHLPLSYLWTFDDSGLPPSSSRDPGALAFPYAGTFSVRLTVYDALGLADSTPASVEVTVYEPPPGPGFVDVTAQAGIDYLQQGSAAAASVGPRDVTGGAATAVGLRDMTGGAAAGDFDRDGHVDLYVTRLDAPDILFRNLGDGTFEDITRQAGLDLDLASNGAAWGDVDNDGDLDLYVTTLGAAETRFYLFINDGNGAFTEEAALRGCALDGPDSHFGFSVALGDYDLDGWLDLHTTEWRSEDDNPLGAPANSRLLRNRGEEAPGSFEDRTNAAGVALDGASGLPVGISGSFALSSRFADLDGDGRPELLVVAGFGSSRLFWNSGDGSFVDGTSAAGVGTDENGAGSDVGDYDGDGLVEWVVASTFDSDDPLADGNRLYRNEGDRVFSDATDLAGVRNGGWSAGAAFYDLDNDGDLDLVMTNGDNGPGGVPEATRIWRNDGNGTMREVSRDLGITEERAGRGVLTFDYDADGDLDLFIVNNAGGPELYRNDAGNQKSWLRVVAVGSRSNRDGIGVVVRVFDGPGPPQVREISGGSHFLGQSELTAHFGLGSGTHPVERVEVFWPASGRTNVFTDVPRNATLTAIEPTEPDESGSGSGSGGGCGLLGIEPVLLGATVALRRRRSAV
jgi:hypothetical protein